jgi:hypothetical protein
VHGVGKAREERDASPANVESAGVMRTITGSTFAVFRHARAHDPAARIALHVGDDRAVIDRDRGAMASPRCAAPRAQSNWKPSQKIESLAPQ